MNHTSMALGLDATPEWHRFALAGSGCHVRLTVDVLQLERMRPQNMHVTDSCTLKLRLQPQGYRHRLEADRRLVHYYVDKMLIEIDQDTNQATDRTTTK